MLFVNEIFGPTVQGEGAASGRHCLFLRVADCNLQCTWCDTAYTWAFNEHSASKLEVPIVHDKTVNRIPMEPAEVLGRLSLCWAWDTDPTMIVISGGEPMMQQDQLRAVMLPLWETRNKIHIETAATIKPHAEFDSLVDQYNVSPKLLHSGNRLSLRHKPEVLEFFARSEKAWFKFVMRQQSDFEEIDNMVKYFDINPHRVMVMPEGITPEDNIRIAKTLIDGAIERGYGLSFRTHILLWADVRGK